MEMGLKKGGEGVQIKAGGGGGGNGDVGMKEIHDHCYRKQKALVNVLKGRI